MQLTDEQRKWIEILVDPRCPLLGHHTHEAVAAALAALDARAAEIERLRAEATALRSEVEALGARIRRHEARARAWEDGPDISPGFRAVSNDTGMPPGFLDFPDWPEV